MSLAIVYLRDTTDRICINPSRNAVRQGRNLEYMDMKQFSRRNPLDLCAGNGFNPHC